MFNGYCPCNRLNVNKGIRIQICTFKNIININNNNVCSNKITMRLDNS